MLLICFLITTPYYLYRYISNLPKKVIAYEGISLGMDMAEVKYILGYPDSVFHPAEDENKGKGKKMMVRWKASKEDITRSANGVNDFYLWDFSRGAKRIDVEFDNSTLKVNSIGCYVDTRNFVDLGTCAVNSIQALDSEEVIFDKLGTPSTSVIDDSTKTVEYSKYNMTISLVKKSAYFIRVKNFQ